MTSFSNTEVIPHGGDDIEPNDSHGQLQGGQMTTLAIPLSVWGRNRGQVLSVPSHMYMWHHTDHLVIQVVPAQGSVAVFRQFHDNVLWMRHVQSTSSYFWTLHHRWVS